MIDGGGAAGAEGMEATAEEGAKGQQTAGRFQAEGGRIATATARVERYIIPCG
jgi:hypothetical protein